MCGNGKLPKVMGKPVGHFCLGISLDHVSRPVPSPLALFLPMEQRCGGMENARNLRAKASEYNLLDRMRHLQTCALQITPGLPNPT